MSFPRPRDVLLQILQGVSEKRWDDLPALYAEVTDVRHPISPAGVAPLLNRDDLRRHFTAAAAATERLRFSPEDVRILETEDPEVVIAEFEYRGKNLDTGRAFAVPCVFVTRVRNGQVVESRDYIYMQAFAAALAH